MKFISLPSCFAWVAFALLASPARAEGPEFNFSGYGTLAATYADTHSAQYRASWRQNRGSQGDVDWGVDSRLGAQLNATLDDTFSGAAQLLAIRRDGGKQLSVEWAYGQAQLGADTVLRVGRLVLPTFMLSDVRNVGYAQHWVRAPDEVYQTFPITSIDGAQLLYRHTWNGVKFTIQPTVGQADTSFYFNLGGQAQLYGPNRFRNLRSLNLSAEKGNWIARFGQTVNNGDLRWVSAPEETLKYTFTSVGLQYDNGSLLAMAEWVDGKTSSSRYDFRGGYIAAGYRLGAWMPYASYSQSENRGTVIAWLPTPRTLALGARWDVVKDVAIKAQAERSRISGQQFLIADPAVDRKSTVGIYTLTVDFVF